MLHRLPPFLRGLISTLLVTLNTLFWGAPVLAMALLKLLPIPALRRLLLNGMHACAESWMRVNGLWMNLAGPIHWDLQGMEHLQRNASILLISNHRSWVDIMALLYPLNRQVPFYKFFLKRELIWVPVLGLCWWALEFPFMKRYSKEYLARHPEKQGDDLATTRKACQRYRTNPVTLINFVEGTRFTPAKHAAQQSLYRHLLTPRAGGVALVLDAMGDQLHGILDATLCYPAGRPSFWQLMCGQVPHISLHIRPLPVPDSFVGRNYATDDAYREEFRNWLNQLWHEKDAALDQLIGQHKHR